MKFIVATALLLKLHFCTRSGIIVKAPHSDNRLQIINDFNPLMECLNISRTIQKKVNNALKHADATEMAIGISSANGKINISRTDNGFGFNPNTIGKDKRLQNIEKRITDIGGMISMETHINKEMWFNIVLFEMTSNNRAA